MGRFGGLGGFGFFTFGVLSFLCETVFGLGRDLAWAAVPPANAIARARAMARNFIIAMLAVIGPDW